MVSTAGRGIKIYARFIIDFCFRVGDIVIREVSLAIMLKIFCGCGIKRLFFNKQHICPYPITLYCFVLFTY